MLPITSPICVNHHRRRNRVRHSDYDLKDIREEGEPVTEPASLPRCQTNFTHTSFSHFACTLHWVCCAPWHVLALLCFLRITRMPRSFLSHFAWLLIHTAAQIISHLKKKKKTIKFRSVCIFVTSCNKLTGKSLKSRSCNVGFFCSMFTLVCFVVVLWLWEQIPNQPILLMLVFP